MVVHQVIPGGPVFLHCIRHIIGEPFARGLRKPWGAGGHRVVPLDLYGPVGHLPHIDDVEIFQIWISIDGEKLCNITGIPDQRTLEPNAFEF